jgi:hypothetical protein
MNIKEALQQKIIYRDKLEGHIIYRCTKCSEYLIHSMGNYCFGCDCYSVKLEDNDKTRQDKNGDIAR